MLQLAGIEPGDDAEKTYVNKLNNGELRHPMFASLRVRVALPKPSATELGSPLQDSANDKDRLSVIVMEAEEFNLTDIPNDSIQAIHGVLACMPTTNDHLAAVS